MSGSRPTTPAGVQFRKAQQVYQNLCCSFVALSFQKSDLVPDLILPGGCQALFCLNICQIQLLVSTFLSSYLLVKYFVYIYCGRILSIFTVVGFLDS